MSRQPHRLPAQARHGFGGSAIDRSKPLSFRLNGRTNEAFEGDTVLSALLAAGVDTAGLFRDEPIAISERFAPPVIARSGKRKAASATPMDRTPVVAGLDLETIGPALNRAAQVVAPIVNRFARGRTLGHRLDDIHALEGAWLLQEPVETLTVDTVVVGGGLAGMAAAVAAAKTGRVILVERQSTLGGDARFFGTVGDEEAPETAIARLTEAIAKTPSIEVLTCTDTFNVAGNRVRAHQVRVKDGKLDSRVIRLTAPRIVFATGSAERIPVFGGNRSPGVIGAVAAFNRAERFGVWSGNRAIFAGPHNFTYRLALLAADAGITVQRVADSRPGPQSRFVDFCKASGITLAAGLAVRTADTTAKGSDVKVSFAVAIEGATASESEPIATDLLVAAGTWQPRLALWLMAGGQCSYDQTQRSLLARGQLDGVRLAGGAAGLRSLPACIRSGEFAIASLLGEAGTPVEDVEVDAIYETRSGPMPIAPWRAGRGVAYLDGGMSFAPRPQQLRKDAPVIAATSIHSLTVGDVVSAVEVGSIPVADAGIVAQERCLGSGDIENGGWRATAPPAPTTEVPPYLTGRFGPKPIVLTVVASDSRGFEPGCLVYPNSDLAEPFAAIGVVVGPASDGGTRLLLSRAASSASASLVVRDIGGPVTVKVKEKPKPAAAKPA